MAHEDLSILETIERTKRKQPISEQAIRALVNAYVSNEIPDYQVAAWLMAVCIQGLSDAETSALTEALVESGHRLNLLAEGIDAVDKHSTGGVGDKITLALVPLVAACGLTVAKMSGRGLGFTGGTLDKLESIPGLRTTLTRGEFVQQARRTGLVIAGQTADLAPGDGKLYALRDVTATVDSVPLIAASVMSKKIAAGARTVLLDVKFGNGAFVPTVEEAQHLARSMLTVGRQAGLKVAAALTSMSQPLGRAIGNALEVAEAIDVLSGDGPSDVSLLTCHLAVELLLLAQRATSAEQAAELVDRALRSGNALQHFSDLVQAQGGDRRVVDTPALLPKARVQQAVRAPRGGFVRGIDARKLGYAAVSLGAGRQRKGEAINHAVGFVLKAKVGEAVAQNEALAIVHASSEPAAERAAAAVIAAYDLGDTPPVIAGLVARMLR